MARKRLSPLVAPSAPALSTAPAAAETRVFGATPELRHSAPPIARVAGESAAEAALATLSAEVTQARAEGRLIVPLAITEIAEDHLVRDRVAVDEEEMAVLMASISDRGQQTAIDVIDLGADGGAGGRRYGLISGWRRLLALRRLHGATGEERFATIKALVRQPETAAEAYRAMVDENEIRVGLGYWERARIAVRAAEIGLYPTVQLALRDLFAAASRAKRSKIGSFVTLYLALGDDALDFPAALPERLGLALAKAVEEDPDLPARLAAELAAAPAATAAEEQARLAAVLERGGPQAGPTAAAAPVAQPRGRVAEPSAEEVGAPIRLRRVAPGRLVLEGPGVDAAFEAKLAVWLAGVDDEF